MKRRNQVIVVIFSVVFLTLSLWNILGEAPFYSESERRALAKFPELTGESLFSGEFAEDFDAYAVDHFPARDAWRKMKAYVQMYVLGKMDNNGIYLSEGHVSKIEYPMNPEMLDYALQLFGKVKELYLEDNEIYLAVIPDKNRYLAEERKHLSMDYDAFSKYMREGMPYADYIEIADLLEAEDYYATDTHWKQEEIVDVAERIAGAMGADISSDYRKCQLENPFYGVYLGQSALDLRPDQMVYLVNETLQGVSVEGAQAMYDMKKAEGLDAYEIFLSGNQPVIRIENKENLSGNRLIIFRDSFGSSIAPLFVKGYSEIVLVDLRYISSENVGELVDFGNADVLFLYSTLLLNNSRSMK